MTALELAADEAFVQRVAVAYAAVAHAALTPPTPPVPDPVRLAQLAALKRLGSPSQVRGLAVDTMALVVGSPEVLTAVATNTIPSDAALITVAERVLAAFSEYAALGGSV